VQIRRQGGWDPFVRAGRKNEELNMRKSLKNLELYGQTKRVSPPDRAPTR